MNKNKVVTIIAIVVIILVIILDFTGEKKQRNAFNNGICPKCNNEFIYKGAYMQNSSSYFVCSNCNNKVKIAEEYLPDKTSSMYAKHQKSRYIAYIVVGGIMIGVIALWALVKSNE